MDLINIILLRSLNKTQYYQFIQTCLGITVFLNNNNQLNKDFQDNNESQSFNEFWHYNEFLYDNKNVEVFASIDSEEEKQYPEEQRLRESNLYKRYDRRSYPKILAYFKINESVVKTFLIYKRDYENKVFRDNNNHVYYTIGIFNFLGDSLLFILLVGICGFTHLQNLFNGIFAKLLYRPTNNLLRTLLLLLFNFQETDIDTNKLINLCFPMPHPKYLSDCDFILGAGVNSDFNIGGWDPLIYNIEKAILTKPKWKWSTGIFDKFKRSLSNTNYISPQILKDINEKEYKKIIYNILYNKGYDPNKTQLSANPNLNNTNLFQIARIASSRKQTTKVLTFNYDNVFEQVISNSFPGTNYNIIYKNSRKPLYTHTPDIEIIHSHGYMPMSSPPHKSYSIIFSSFEYMEAYKTPNIFARKKLIEQLRNTNLIIGNSLSDYEEQKVFYANHRKFLSHFDYILVRRNMKLWMDIYQAIYFYQMGVIPIIFDDFNRMNDYLKKI